MRVLVPLLLLAAGPALAQSEELQAPPGALSCSGCHGAGSDIPLDGLSSEEIATAMLGYKDGSRDGTLMPRLAAGFDEAEIVAIAEWIAAHGEDAQ